METLKDKKIAKLEKKIKELPVITGLVNETEGTNHAVRVLEYVELDKVLEIISALSEQPDTAQTVRDELLKFYLWKCKNNRFADFENDTHESIIDEYLSSTSNLPKETV